jgi:hypothetical protein
LGSRYSTKAGGSDCRSWKICSICCGVGKDILSDKGCAWISGLLGLSGNVLPGDLEESSFC